MSDVIERAREFLREEATWGRDRACSDCEASAIFRDLLSAVGAADPDEERLTREEWAEELREKREVEQYRDALRRISKAARTCNESVAQAGLALATCGQIAEAMLKAAEGGDDDE